MRNLFLVLFCFFTGLAYGQEFEISGKLVDSISLEPLESATVFLTKPADTSLVAYTLSDEKGNFLVKGKSNEKKIHLNISYVGYKPYINSVEINSKEEIKLDSIYLPAKIEGLDEVLVEGITPPIIFKNDTIEFNVDSFKADENAYLEDFLKILPGFRVDKKGNISFNGKPVDKVMVNGKRFFDDPKLATQNLSKGLIEKIQVLDSRSKTQVFTGEKGDGKSKTINLEVAKENNKGVFGNLESAAGTNERYQLKGAGNYFNDELRLSLIATGDNITSDYSNVMRYRGPANVGGGGGVNKTQSLASNFVNEWGDHIDFSGNYRYQNEENFKDQKRKSENRLPDNRKFFNESAQSTTSRNRSQTVQSQFETTLDSVYLIQFAPSFSYSENVSGIMDNQRSLNEARELRNSSESSNNSRNFNKRYENNLTATRKYGQKGGYFQMLANLSFSNNESDLENKSETKFYSSDVNGPVLDSILIRDQYRDGNQENIHQSYTFKWKMPVVKNFSITPSYQYSSQVRNNKFLVYDQGNGVPVLNNDQSTDYKNHIYEHRPQVEARYFKDRFSAQVGINPVFRYIESSEAFNSINFSNNFSALELSSNISLPINNSTGFNLYYELRSAIPNINQFSPYVDQTDPLHIKKGNPDLKPVTFNTIQLNFSRFNVEKHSNLNLISRFTSIKNAVIARTDIGEDLVRRSTYVNVGGNYDFHLQGQYSKRIMLDSIKHLRYFFQPTLNISNHFNFINGEFYRSINKNFSPSFSFSYNPDVRQQYTISYNPSFGNNRFSSENMESTDFVRHNLVLSGNTKIWKIYVSNNLSYKYNSNIGDDFDKNSFSWNSALTCNVLNNKGSITLDAYDILNQNSNARRYSVGESVIDVESSIQRRYFMLGFKYRFNTMGKPKQTHGTFQIDTSY